MLVLGAYDGVSALSKLIAMKTRSDKTHVSVIQLPDDVVDRSGQILWHRLQSSLNTCPVWEAWGSLFKPSLNRVHKRVGIHDGHTPGTMIHLLRVDPAFGIRLNEATAVAFLDSRVGTKYDWLGLHRWNVNSPKGDDSRLFCSEYGFLAFIAYGAPLLARTRAEAVSPADLYRSSILTELISTRTKGEKGDSK